MSLELQHNLLGWAGLAFSAWQVSCVLLLTHFTEETAEAQGHQQLTQGKGQSPFRVGATSRPLQL